MTVFGDAVAAAECQTVGRQHPEPEFRHLSGLRWASLGVLELTALPTIGAERWVPWIREAHVLLVDGGDATYLCHWMRESSLTDIVWVGVSAGSTIPTPITSL